MTTEPYTGATQYQADATALLQEAQTLAVGNAEDLAAAADLRERIKQLHRSADAERDQRKRPHLEAGREIDAAYRPVLDNFVRAVNAVDTAIKTYQRRESERAAAEARRQAAEADAARKLLEAQARKAEKKGDEDTAQQLRTEAEFVPPPMVASKFSTAGTGVGMREHWSFEVTDMAALIKAVAASKAPLALLMADERVIRGQVNSLKGQTNIPGVRVWRDDQVAQNGRR
jgi:hypothetical protein